MADPLFAKYGREAPAGEVLFREGEKGADMFVVRSGSVRIFIKSGGKEKTLANLGPGEFVGEMSLLTGQPRSATAVVHEDAALLVVSGKVLEEMIVHNTEIALRLIRKLARRLESTDSLVQVLLHRDPNQRVIENLKRLAVLHGWSPGNKVVLQADCRAVAEQVGLEFEEVQDVISRLVRAGAMTEEDGAWTIESPERLGDFLKFLQRKSKFS
jgi:CRP/FNR family cyclic AMP-dependent transcriptional regulator